MPREACIIADNSLLASFLSGKKVVDKETVDSAYKDRVENIGEDRYLAYKSPDETIRLTLIKWSISDEAKSILSVNAPSKYKWISLPFVAHIAFTPRDKKIVRHLTNGLLLVPPKRIRRSALKRKKILRPKADGNRKQGFASSDPYKRTLIASEGGKKAHVMGRAHKWTPEEARRAGKIGGTTKRLRH